VSASSEGLPRARKRLGQHFLADTRVLDRIVTALGLTGQETVIEIGPGRGALTDRLVGASARLVAIEVDRDLVPYLRARYADRPQVRIVEADVLRVDLAALADGPYVLAGNVPYYITTPILFQALRAPRPLRAVYLVQREVAERVAAAPGSKAYGALSVNVQTVARAELICQVPPKAFRPPPAVDSAVLRVVPREDALLRPDEEDAFRSFVQALFAQRRKQLGGSLRPLVAEGVVAAEALAAVGIAATERVERVAPDTLVRLFRAARGVSPGA
jgi:16S rRNA (adenine1518-N6/adenine1519-N6)-dimethyltransferase